jgi:hypothetical protein
MIQNIMGLLLQALEIIFEVQRKRSNEKDSKKENKPSNLQNVCFFLFSSLWTLLLLNLITFLFLIYFKRFKVL